MIHPLHDYLAAQLDKLLRDRRMVVFYDPKGDFTPFFDELDIVGTGRGDLPRVGIGETLTHLARFDGSFFALKAAVEPIAGLDKPDALLIQVTGRSRERTGSALMEIEKAGAVFGDSPSHGLRSIARRLLRVRFTDGDIDQMLAPEALTYQDIVGFLTQDAGGAGSLVKVVLGAGSSEELVTRWLAAEETDPALEAKLATTELMRLVEARMGLSLDPGIGLGKARRHVLRFLLVNEFRADLGGPAPASLDLISAPATKEQLDRVREVAERLRRAHAATYTAIADGIETELQLPMLGIAAAALGTIDTFRFEEALLLGFAAELVASGHYAQALDIVQVRGKSFWVDRDLQRQGQWEACRLMAELGSQVARVRPLVRKACGPSGKASEAATMPARAWVEAYAGDWYRVDRAQRALESWVAKMEDEPEPASEKAIGLVRRGHETLIQEMAEGFSRALAAAGWSVPGILHQTRIYPELVEPVSRNAGRVAYFFVDAMRFEMATELVDQLGGARDVRIVPAVAALPSITPIGMAALLPGASASFSVVDHKGKLASRIGDSVMPALPERMKYLKAVRPDAKDIDLGDLLQKSTRALEKQLEGVSLVVVRSQSIDGLGEMDGGLLARQIMDTVIGNIARAVRKLGKIGVEHIVVTADHGHQFSVRKDEDMLMDKPGGDTVDQHRRCWAGRGGQTSAAAQRVTGAELGYQTDLDFIFPKGLAVFRAGGDLAFHHGGASLQEMIVPVVTLRTSDGKAVASKGARVVLDGYPKVLTNRTFGMTIRSDLAATAVVPARLLLLAEGQEVGRAGMAVDAELDRVTATVQVPPQKAVSMAMLLTRDEFKKVRVVALDPTTDEVLAQSDEIEVKLGM